MFGHNLALATVRGANLQMDFTILHLGALRRASQMQRQLSDDFVANEPSTRRAQSFADDVQAQLFRQIVKCPRSIGIESRTRSRTKAGLRMPDLLPPRTWLARRLTMEMQFSSAADHLHICPSLAQQSCQIQSGSSATDHHNAATSERFDFAMASTVREKLRRKMRQILGNMFEMGNANRQHNLAGLKSLAVLKPQKKAAGRAIHAGNELVFQLRHHAIPEGKAICAERIKLHRNTGV